mgnify:CR=1 FL=1
MNQDYDLTQSEFARMVKAEHSIKLLRKEISELKVENGMLQSERDELADSLVKIQAEKHVLSEQDKIKIRADERVISLNNRISNLEKSLKAQKQGNEILIAKLYKTVQ